MPRTESALEAGSAYRILWGKETRSGPGSGAVGSDPWSFLLGERRDCSSSDRRNPPWSTRQEHGCARPTGDLPEGCKNSDRPGDQRKRVEDREPGPLLSYRGRI